MASVPPSDLVINGLDLTTVFARYISGPKASPTGIFINGQDLCNVFAPYIIGQKANPTGIYVGGGGIDICNIFLPINAVIPIAPTNLSVSSVTNSTASLSFNTVVGAISYIATTTTGITGASTSFPLIIPGLAAGTLYTVSLRTINPWGMSNPTKPINVTTFPVVPTLTTTISDVSMTIVYPTFPTLTYYTATVTPTLGGSSSIFSSTTATLSVTGLTSNTGYKVAYLTSNVAGQSIPSILNYTTAPSPPTNLDFSNVTTTSAILSFSTAVGATSYLVSVLLNSITASTSSGTSSPINISLLGGNTYNIYMQSIRNGIYSNPSGIVTLTTLPPSPTITSVTPTFNTITVNFSTSNGAISYQANAVPSSGSSRSSTSFSSSIVITGLASLTNYTITVYAINSAGSSASTSTSTTTLDVATFTGITYTRLSSTTYSYVYSITSAAGGSIVFNTNINNAKVLIVGGGGGGGAMSNSYSPYSGYPYGGGGGGVGYGSLNFVSNITYNLTIGSGGQGQLLVNQNSSNIAGNGGNSSITGGSINETAYGGQGSQGYTNNYPQNGPPSGNGSGNSLTYTPSYSGGDTQYNAGGGGSYFYGGGGGAGGSAANAGSGGNVTKVQPTPGPAYNWISGDLNYSVGAGGYGLVESNSYDGSTYHNNYFSDSAKSVAGPNNTGKGGAGVILNNYGYGLSGGSGIIVIAFNI